MVWLGAEITWSPVVPPGFYLLHVNVGQPVLPATAAALLCHTIVSLFQLAVSAPLLVWMNVSSLTPWWLDFHSLIFWKFWLFFGFRLVGILFKVVWRGEACLPIPPSLLEIRCKSFLIKRRKWLWFSLWERKMFLFACLLKDFIYLFLERGEGKEKERERNISVWLPLAHPVLGTWPTPQACALTGNQISDPLVCRLLLKALCHTSQYVRWLFKWLFLHL